MCIGTFGVFWYEGFFMKGPIISKLFSGETETLILEDKFQEIFLLSMALVSGLLL